LGTPGLRRNEETIFLLYPALIPQRAMRASGTYWAKLSSRLTAVHFSGSYGVVGPEWNRGEGWGIKVREQAQF
jgi:hypothetical protein